ncbi:MAG: DHA2 family efflux MFS transporter permease subunit [Pseudomonadota bacterium]
MSRSVEAMTARYGRAYPVGVIAMAIMSTMAAVLSGTIINVAIPDIMGSFGIDQVQAQWLASGFLACMAVTMVMVDWSCRAVGQPVVMAGAAAAFLVFSIVGGLANSIEVLSLSRIVQGAAAGYLQPLSMIAVMQVFPPERRGTALGIYGVGAVLAPGMGPFFGGVLMDAFDWRYVFYAGAPLSAMSLLLVVLFMPQPDDQRERTAFDWPGVVLMAVMILSTMTALTDGVRHGWHDESVVLRFTLGAACLGTFIWWELKTATPLVDLHIFRSPAFAGAACVSVVLGAGLFGSTYLLPLFAQSVQGLTPTVSGGILLAGGIAMVFLTPLTGRLADRIQPGIQIGFGMSLFAISFILMAGAELGTAALTLALWMMIGRIGMSFIFPALSAGGSRSLPPELLAQGASTLSLLRQLGGALGVSMLAVLLEFRLGVHGAALADTQLPGRAVTETMLDRVETLTEPAGLTTVEQSAVALDFLSRTIEGQAFVRAFSDAFAMGGAVFALAVAAAGLMTSRFGVRQPGRPATAG